MIDISIVWHGIIFTLKLPFLLPVYLCKKIWIILRKCCILTHFLYQLCLLEKTFRKLPRDRKRLLLDIFRATILKDAKPHRLSEKSNYKPIEYILRYNHEIVVDLMQKELLCYKKIGDGLFSKRTIALTNRTINLLHHRYTCRC